MSLHDLERLNSATEVLLNQKAFQETIEQLNQEVNDSAKPFVWAVIDPEQITRDLPESIKSKFGKV